MTDTVGVSALHGDPLHHIFQRLEVHSLCVVSQVSASSLRRPFLRWARSVSNMVGVVKPRYERCACLLDSVIFSIVRCRCRENGETQVGMRKSLV